MPTLLQINITSNWGSTGKIAEQIGLEAQKRGWKSYIAYGRWANPSQLPVYKIGNKLDMYYHYAQNRLFDNEGLCSKRTTRKLIEHIKLISPDVVHLHIIHDHYLNYKLLFEYLNQTSIKVVWTFHDCWAFTGHCMHFVLGNCERWKTGCFSCPLKHRYPKTLIEQSSRNWKLKKELFTSNQYLTIVPCSDWMANFVEQSFLQNKPIHTIHNGIDLNTFRPIVTNPFSSQKQILAVSSVWDDSKGMSDIFKLRGLLSYEEYNITMVGLTEKQLSSLPDGINGIVRTQNVTELIKLYSNADVLINPTYADTFPTVNLEALACGTPVITYNTGGSPEAIDESTGIVVPQGEVNSLKSAIIEISHRERESVRLLCRSRAEKLFNKDERFSEYINLYESLLIN